MLNELRRIPTLILRGKYSVVITTVYPNTPSTDPFFRFQVLAAGKNEEYVNCEPIFIRHNHYVCQLLTWRAAYYTLLPRIQLDNYYTMQTAMFEENRESQPTSWFRLDAMVDSLNIFYPKTKLPLRDINTMTLLRNNLVSLIEMMGTIVHYQVLRRDMPGQNLKVPEYLPMLHDFVLPPPPVVQNEDGAFESWGEVYLGTLDELFIILYNFCQYFDKLKYPSREEERFYDNAFQSSVIS